MSPQDRATGLLQTAAAQLRWFRSPHDLDQILGLHQEQIPATRGTTARARTNEEIIADLERAGGSGDGRSSRGTHSDPTPLAALRSEPDAGPDDETTLALDLRLYELHQNTDRLHRQRTRLAPSRQQILDDVLDRILHAPTDPDYGAARAIADDASWIRTKAEGIWRTGSGDRKPAAAQQPVEPCRNCGRWRSGTIGSRAGYCEQCHKFHSNHDRAWPTEAIVRRWDYGKGPTPAQIQEAKAAAKKGVRRN